MTLPISERLLLRRPEVARFLSPEALVAAITAAGLALRLRKAWLDISTLLEETMSDDAFYYFQIARNIAHGHNVTFDGETLTNGFHPLWMALVTPIYFITDGGDLPIHLTLSLAALLGTGTILLIYATVARVTGSTAAALAAAAFYSLHPYIVLETVNGVETALAVFLLAVTVHLFVSVAQDEGPSAGRFILLGVAGGLMVLARTDLVFVLPPVLLFLALQERGRRRLAHAMASGATAVAVVTPWLLWSLVTQGTVIQVSGVASSEIDRQAYLLANGDSLWTQVSHGLDVSRDTLFDRLPELYFVSDGSLTVAFLAATAAVIALMLLLPLRPQRRQAVRWLGLLAVPAAGILAALLFHAGYRWHLRSWYFAPAGLAGALFLGVLVGYAESVLRGTQAVGRADSHEDPDEPAGEGRQAEWRVRAVALLYVVVIALVLGVYGPQTQDGWVVNLPHRLNMLETARWAAANTENGARVGSFNAGIIGYYSERTVVNLDGVVNNDAYEAQREGRLGAYIAEKQLRYAIDLSATLFLVPCGGGLFECEQVAVIGRPIGYFGGGQLEVLRILPAATTMTSTTN